MLYFFLFRWGFYGAKAKKIIVIYISVNEKERKNVLVLG